MATLSVREAGPEGQALEDVVRLAGCHELDEFAAQVVRLAAACGRADGTLLALTGEQQRLLAATGVEQEAGLLESLPRLEGSVAAAEVRFRHTQTRAEQFVSALALRLEAPQAPLLVCFWRRPVPAEAEPRLRRLQELLGPLLAGALLLEQARAHAAVDPLTGLKNRRTFAEELEREAAHADRYDTPLTLLLFDVDDFKRINDQRGHQTGDRALAHIGHVLAESIRGTDIAYRLGGDEFAVLLPASTTSDAAALHIRLRERLETRASGHSDPTVTVSAGTAQLGAGETVDAWFERADRALYAAKTAGKDQLRTASPPPD